MISIEPENNIINKLRCANNLRDIKNILVLKKLFV